MCTLLIGATGLLGSNLLRTSKEMMLIPSSSKLDLTDGDNISDYFSEQLYQFGNRIDHIILSAAYTNVAKSNTEKDKVYNLNVLGVNRLIQTCYRQFSFNALPIITYISSDYVFKGDIGNYKVTDNLDPVPDNYYALTKAMGESVIRSYPKRQTIRTSFCRSDIWPYQKAFEDQYTSRDTIDIIAPMIYKVIRNRELGTFHIGTYRKRVWDLARKINPLIEPCSRKDIKDVYIPYDTSLEFFDGAY